MKKIIIVFFNLFLIGVKSSPGQNFDWKVFKRYLLISQQLFLILFFCSNYAFAGDRTILIEKYTSSTCYPCASPNNPTIDGWIATKDPYKIMQIAYHMNWPMPGDDPMHHYNITDNNGRRTYYGVNYISQGRFDGNTSFSSPYSSSMFQTMYDNRINSLSPISLYITTQNITLDSIEVVVKVYCETGMENPDVTLHIAVLENLVQYSTPPGSNGETTFRGVMRKMLPTFSGTPVSLLLGQSIIVKQKYKIDPAWTSAKVIAFIQRNDTKEIIQSGQQTADFTLLTDPAYKTVNQGVLDSGTFQISTPVTASGYASPITFNAAIEPSNAGITTSFPNGNTLNNFSQSIPLKINSNSSVPAGTYRITITGTNILGKSHKIVASYIVGTNVVLVGTNKPNLTFKVNGISYTTTQLFTWNFNTTQTLEAITPQGSENKQSVFVNWNTAQTTPLLNINVNANQNQYIANFKTQFRITSSTNPPGIPATITNGNMFHDSGSTVNMNISPISVQFNGKTYWFQSWHGTGNGSYTGGNRSFALQNLSNPIEQIAIFDTINTGISNIGSEIPDIYKLYQNYPNPFNPATNIKFDIPQQGLVVLKIYDMLGKEVAMLSNQVLQAGRYEANWNASAMPSGVYFYKLETPAYSEIKRMVLVK